MFETCPGTSSCRSWTTPKRNPLAARTWNPPWTVRRADFSLLVSAKFVSTSCLCLILKLDPYNVVRFLFKKHTKANIFLKLAFSAHHWLHLTPWQLTGVAEKWLVLMLMFCQPPSKRLETSGSNSHFLCIRKQTQTHFLWACFFSDKS